MHVFFLLIAKLTEVAPKRHSAGFDSAGGFCATLRIVRGVLCNLPTQKKKNYHLSPQKYATSILY